MKLAIFAGNMGKVTAGQTLVEFGFLLRLHRQIASDVGPPREGKKKVAV